MSTPTVFVIKNQAGQFLNKHQEWIDGSDRQLLYRTAHRDEAVNTVFEVSSKDIYLRAEAIACEVDGKGQPLPQGGDLLTQDAIPLTAETNGAEINGAEVDISETFISENNAALVSEAVDLPEQPSEPLPGPNLSETVDDPVATEEIALSDLSVATPDIGSSPENLLEENIETESP